MIFDDSEPKKKPELVFRKLDTLSVEALKEYRTELEAEIARIDAEIPKRGTARHVAESFFKKNSN